MPKAECLNPLPHPRQIGWIIPCRKCKVCIRMMRLDWINRLKLECFGRPNPFFCTWTFAPEHYENSEAKCKADIQRFWKRLRKAGHDLRYFTVIERGSQKHRLHGHSIIWSHSLSAMGGSQAYLTLKQHWGKGRIDMQPLRGASGISYVTKYMVKDLSDEQQRNYQWSMKPMLGDSGHKHWINQCDHYHNQLPWTITHLPPNRIIFQIAGKLETCWIPKVYWMEYCKSKGIEFLIPEYKAPEDQSEKILKQDTKSVVYQLCVSEAYRKAKAIRCA